MAFPLNLGQPLILSQTGQWLPGHFSNKQRVPLPLRSGSQAELLWPAYSRRWSGNAGECQPQLRRAKPVCPKAVESAGQADTGNVGIRSRATIPEQQAATELLEAAEAALGGSSAPSARKPTVVLEVDELFLQRICTAQDAEEVLRLIAETCDGGEPGVIGNSECARMIESCAARGKAELALSILTALGTTSLRPRRGVRRGGQLAWEWPPADVGCYAALVRGLAAALRVQDAVQAVERLRRRGVPEGDEVPFGKVVECPTCQIPLAVVQPQNGVQLVACSKCRYQYELMSGEVVSCDSESISSSVSALQRGLRLLRLSRKPPPAATHSMVVCAPDGTARTHRFATGSADIPAQVGERVSVASAAPSSAKKRRALGLYAASTRVPGWQPCEPMALTNHATGRVSPLLRAPPKEGSGGSVASWLPTAVLLLASSDVATGFIDPALPGLLALGAASALAAGGAANRLLLPRLNQLPQRSAEAVSSRQTLLAQHTEVEQRLQALSQAAREEVRMLARLWQLQNKMEAVGDPATFGARMVRVQEARAGLEERLTSRLELIDRYAKIASIAEIEVEMGSELPAAEAAATAAIAEQMANLQEVDILQEEWRYKAEANDDLERLLRSAPPLPD